MKDIWSRLPFRVISKARIEGLQKTMVELRTKADFYDEVGRYYAWFEEVFKKRVTVPGARFATSWSEEESWGQRAHVALLDIELDYVRVLLREIQSSDVPGILVEFGIYEGWWVDWLYSETEAIGLDRPVYGLDSFEGLSEPSPLYDSPFWERGMYTASLESVRERIKATERPRINLVKGWFHESLSYPEISSIDQIAYARIDCDIYEPARECLEYLGPRLSNGAVLVFDDWPHTTDIGEGKAFAEWLPSVPHLTFEFLFYNTSNHMYLRVHHLGASNT